MEIPKDIARMASGIVNAMPRRAPFISDVTNAVAQAILAERNRCARIADANAHTDCEVAEQIAKSIRSGA